MKTQAEMTFKKELEWHHYDQGLFYLLAKDPDGHKAEKFADFLGEELQVDCVAHILEERPHEQREEVPIGSFR